MRTEDPVSTVHPEVNPTPGRQPGGAARRRDDAVRRDSASGAHGTDAPRTEARVEPEEHTPEEAGYGYGV